MNGCEARSLLHPYLLLLIHERPAHGYELIERLGRLGVSDVEPGHAYRVLRGMERARLVASTWEASGAGPARRRYELTEEGVQGLREWVPRLNRLGEAISSFLTRWDASGIPGVFAGDAGDAGDAGALQRPPVTRGSS